MEESVNNKISKMIEIVVESMILGIAQLIGDSRDECLDTNLVKQNDVEPYRRPDCNKREM